MHDINYAIYLENNVIVGVSKILYEINMVKNVSLITEWNFNVKSPTKISKRALFELLDCRSYQPDNNKRYILIDSHTFKNLFGKSNDEENSICILESLSQNSVYIYEKEYYSFIQELKNKAQQFIKENNSNEEVKNKTLPPISEKVKAISEYVIGQDEAIKKAVLAIYNNLELLRGSYSNSELITLKNNILMSGPSGCGKTEIARQLASHFDIPIFCDDITQYSGTGWKGKELIDLLMGLYIASGKDIKLAEQGILVLDEIDKISINPENQHTSNHNTLEVQRGLLKIIEGGKFELYTSDMRKSLGTFDTSHLTVIGLGNFNNFGRSEDTPSSEYDYFTKCDYISYGLIPELVGRFKTFITLNNLSFEDKKRILLQSKLSILNLKLRQLTNRGIKINIINGIDKLCEEIVRKSEELGDNCGARDLNDIAYNIFAEIDYLLYDCVNPKEIIFNDDIVNNPSRVYIK